MWIIVDADALTQRTTSSATPTYYGPFETLGEVAAYLADAPSDRNFRPAKLGSREEFMKELHECNDETDVHATRTSLTATEESPQSVDDHQLAEDIIQRLALAGMASSAMLCPGIRPSARGSQSPHHVTMELDAGTPC